MSQLSLFLRIKYKLVTMIYCGSSLTLCSKMEFMVVGYMSVLEAEQQPICVKTLKVLYPMLSWRRHLKQLDSFHQMHMHYSVSNQQTAMEECISLE